MSEKSRIRNSKLWNSGKPRQNFGRGNNFFLGISQILSDFVWYFFFVRTLRVIGMKNPFWGQNCWKNFFSWNFFLEKCFFLLLFELEKYIVKRGKRNLQHFFGEILKPRKSGNPERLLKIRNAWQNQHDFGPWKGLPDFFFKLKIQQGM